jgi:SecD/SecF fusion protein
MYTAIVVTRMFFELLAKHTGIQRLKFFSWVRETSIDFIGVRYIAIALSLVVIIGSLVMFVQRGKSNFGVDFTGGATATFTFTEKQPVETVRGALSVAGIDATPQYQKEMGAEGAAEEKEFLELRVGFDEGDAAVKAVTASFPDYKLVKQDAVGPQVGKELQKKGLIAIGVSLLGMIIYISFRFEFAFAMGAVVALFHDVLVTVGVYCLLGRPLSLNTIAAVLTIIGFSVNDTIVIFDRIREDMKLYRGRSFNQTLSRTLLTSFTALLSVVALLVFGGGAINDFALAMFIGMISGVYSTVYIATPVVMLWHREKKIAND